MNPKLPNFIIAGVMKGGTTAAAINLDFHPDIFMVNATSKMEDIDYYDLDISDCKGGLPDPHKELDFFNQKDNYNKGIDFYKHFFSSDKFIRGESSPNYFCLHEYEGTLQRMAYHIPDAKVLIILRDPIQSAFTHWNMIQYFKMKWCTRFHDKSFYDCVNMKHHNQILKRSTYFENLALFKLLFKENLYIALSENIIINPVNEYNKIYEFLGVSPINQDPGYGIHFVGKYTNTNKVDEKSKEYLLKLFKPDVDKLKLGFPEIDFSVWDNY